MHGLVPAYVCAYFVSGIVLYVFVNCFFFFSFKVKKEPHMYVKYQEDSKKIIVINPLQANFYYLDNHL